MRILIFLILVVSIHSLCFADAKEGMQYFWQKDYVNALKHLEPAAEKGNKVSSYYAGYIYRYGKGVPRNTARAKELFTRSAKKNYAYAVYELGVMRCKGVGYKKDLIGGEKFIKRAFTLANKQQRTYLNKRENWRKTGNSRSWKWYDDPDNVIILAFLIFIIIVFITALKFSGRSKKILKQVCLKLPSDWNATIGKKLQQTAIVTKINKKKAWFINPSQPLIVAESFSEKAKPDIIITNEIFPEETHKKVNTESTQFSEYFSAGYRNKQCRTDDIFFEFYTPILELKVAEIFRKLSLKNTNSGFTITFNSGNMKIQLKNYSNVNPKELAELFILCVDLQMVFHQVT
ncbi:sel1 repeat family protein [bacterium]|nr:sel1 repeat family protein [bacterium]